LPFIESRSFSDRRLVICCDCFDVYELLREGAARSPVESSKETSRILCVLCGEGAVADGVLNVAFLLPLGASLMAVGCRPHALALGPPSFAVETGQLVIPSCDPSLADFLFNVIGTTLGIALARTASV